MRHEGAIAGADRRLDRGATEFVREAHARALYWQEHKSVNPRKLTPPFDAEMVGRDMRIAEDLARTFAREDSVRSKEESMIATSFEVGLWWLTRQKQFLGERTSAVLPSRYDDYVNGVDLILEIMSKDEQVAHMGLGIDATFGAGAVNNKLRELSIHVGEGHAAEVKYFVSSDQRYKGSLGGIPKAVVGLSVGRARELAQLWRISERGEKPPVAADAHPLRVLVLRQLVAQTSALAAFARAHGHQQLARNYDVACKRLMPIHDAARRALPETAWKDIEGNDYRQDPVHMTILKQVESWRKVAAEQASD